MHRRAGLRILTTWENSANESSEAPETDTYPQISSPSQLKLDAIDGFAPNLRSKLAGLRLSRKGRGRDLRICTGPWPGSTGLHLRRRGRGRDLRACAGPWPGSTGLHLRRRGRGRDRRVCACAVRAAIEIFGPAPQKSGRPVKERPQKRSGGSVTG